VQRIHANGMAAWLCAGTTGRLQHTKLRLKLSYVALERIEGSTNLVWVISVIGERNVLDARKRRQ
jgi:hypothetical protein